MYINGVLCFAGDWRDEMRYEERPSRLDDMTDWDRRTARRSVTDEVVDKVVDYINDVQPFGSPKKEYR